MADEQYQRRPSWRLRALNPSLRLISLPPKTRPLFEYVFPIYSAKMLKVA